MKYWAYRHISGHIKVKRYLEDGMGREAVDDALDSDFVDEVFGPYEAINRVQAEQIAKERLSISEAVSGVE